MNNQTPTAATKYTVHVMFLVHNNITLEPSSVSI